MEPSQTTATITFTRYRAPLPENVPYFRNKRDLMKIPAWPDVVVSERNGGYYLEDDQGNVVGIATDAMCEDLDRRQAHLDRFLAEQEHRQAAGLPELEYCDCGACPCQKDGGCEPITTEGAREDSQNDAVKEEKK